MPQLVRFVSSRVYFSFRWNGLSLFPSHRLNPCRPEMESGTRTVRSYSVYSVVRHQTVTKYSKFMIYRDILQNLGIQILWNRGKVFFPPLIMMERWANIDFCPGVSLTCPLALVSLANFDHLQQSSSDPFSAPMVCKYWSILPLRTLDSKDPIWKLRPVCSYINTPLHQRFANGYSRVK